MAGKDALAELDTLDMDHLLSYFQPSAATNALPMGFPEANLMQPQVPFRSAVGTGARLPAQQPLTANLFSSIMMTEPTGMAPLDSGDSTGEGGDGRKRSGEDRSQAIQEKNRRAQKRFRERQASARWAELVQCTWVGPGLPPIHALLCLGMATLAADAPLPGVVGCRKPR